MVAKADLSIRDGLRIYWKWFLLQKNVYQRDDDTSRFVTTLYDENIEKAGTEKEASMKNTIVTLAVTRIHR